MITDFIVRYNHYYTALLLLNKYNLYFKELCQNG